MQEIRDNTSVNPSLNLPNKSMWPYLAVPTYLMELLWNFSSCLEQLKGRTFRLCLSYLALFETNQREYGNKDNMIPQP
jgi:hypothetical protein